MDFNTILEKVKEFWKKLSLPYKIGIISGITLIVFSILFLSFRGGGPEYGILFSGLDPKDASKIVEELKKSGVTYKLTQEGKTILVPKDRVYDLRLMLSAKGLPSMGVVGFEIFDKTNLSRTEFTQKIEFRRALEGELTRTITRLNEIERARIHIVIPEKTLFIEEEKPATASVLLQLKPGAHLTPAQVKGIVHLISSAVEGLDPSNVTIVDTNGNILTDMLEDETNINAPERSIKNMELEREFEQKLERRVRAMLENVLGPGNVVVRVKAQLNFDKKKINKEIYQPVTEDKGIIRSSQEIEKKEKVTGSKTSGVPGTSSNVVEYPAGVATGGNVEKSEKNVITNYEISKVQESIEEAPGSIERLSVSVIVGKKLKQEELDAIKRAVAAACGIVPSRGDQIAVEEVPFDKTYIEKEKAAMEKEAKREFMLAIFKLVSIVIIFLALLGVVLYVLRSMQKRRAALEVMLGEEAPEGVVSGEGAVEEAELAERPKTPEEMRRELIYKEIENLAKENPEEIVRIIRSWFAEDER